MRLKTLISNSAMLILFVLLAIGIYYQSAFVYFLSDDFIWLLESSKSTIVTLPTNFISADGFFYRPTTKIYFYFLYQWFGLNAQYYHLLNILIHGVNGFLFFILAKRLLNTANIQRNLALYISLFSAIFLIVHPIHLEPVVWVSAVTELIPTLFMFALINLYLFLRTEYAGKGSINNISRYLLYLIICLGYFLAMGGHEFAIVLPAIFIVIDLYLNKVSTISKLISVIKAHVVEYSLFLLTALIYLLLRYIANSHWQGGDYSYNLLKLPLNILGNLFGYTFFVILGPWFYEYYENIRFTIRNYVTYVFLILGTILLFVSVYRVRFINLLRSVNPVLLVFAATAFIGLVPFLGLGTIAERYVYFSSGSYYVIFCYFVYEITQKLFPKLRVMREFLGIMLFCSILFSILTFVGMRDWHSASAKVQALVFGSCVSVEDGDIVVLEETTNRVGRAWVFQVGYEQAVELVCQKGVNSLSE